MFILIDLYFSSVKFYDLVFDWFHILLYIKELEGKGVKQRKRIHKTQDRYYLLEYNA